MAKILNKDPLTFQQEKTEFLKELHNFHRNRGTPFDNLPKIGGKEIDLYLLYRRVISFGGLRKINDEETWNQISSDLRMPNSCCNGSQALKHVYVRYLNKYERVHFHGEDPNKKEFDDDNDHAPARKKVKLPLYGIPLFYNHEQHKVTDAVREMYGLSQDLTASSDYEKLERSLLSGLPNEVDFVVNICTLLSNEGRHILRLDQSRYLLTLLMAHIGLFDYSKDGLEVLYENGWCKYSKRNFIRFWFDTVKDGAAKMLISSTRDCKPDECEGESVLNLSRDLGINDKEGQRVTQLAVILRNLSFQEENCKFMASNDLVFRFLILCINCHYGSLRQLALDTFGNLAEKLIIDDDADKNLILDLISKCISSNDKFDVVRGLEILGKMCQIEENELHIAEGLNESIYSQLLQLACVYDIQLIVHSLETLYQLSELGEETSTKIASVKNAVDLLVTLLSIEAQSYGPNSLIGIKVVEYCPPAGTAGDKKIHEGSPVPNGQKPAVQALQQNPNHQQQSLAAPTSEPATISSDIESATRTWLQTTFEVKGDHSISQSHLYAEYVQFCKKYSVSQILPTHSFHNTVKLVFPAVQVVASDRSDGTKELSYHGLSKGQSTKPVLVRSSVNKPSSVLQGLPSANSDLTQTPMLRQRLLDPPRLSPLQASPSLLPVGGNVTSSHSAIQSPVSLPVMSKSKALLQAKLQQTRFVQQPIVQQPMVQQPMVQQNWFQSSNMSTQNVATPGAILQVSHAVKNNVIVTQPVFTANVQQNLPVVIEGMSVEQLDSANKPIETKMIKNLLAKKLRPVNTPVPICPKTSEPAPSPMHLLTFTAQQSNVIQGHIQNQPIIPQMIIQQSPVAQSRPLGPKPEKSPVKVIESSQKPPTTPGSEGKRKPTRSSARVPSPKGTSPKRSTSPRTNSPKSPKTYDLDVCGKIERAKDLTQIGIEAKIEHIENKSVNKSEQLNDPSTPPNVLDDTNDTERTSHNTENQNNSITASNNSAITAKSSSLEISSTSNLITNDSHQNHNSNCEANEMCDKLNDQSSLSLVHHCHDEVKSVLENKVFLPSICEKDSKTDVTANSFENRCIPSKKEIITNGHIDDQSDSDSTEITKVVKDVPVVNMNGNISSPEVIIPSPTCEMNGISEEYEVKKSFELKQAITKIVDKAGKLNGAINHNLNDYAEHNGENTMVNGTEAMDCSDNTLHVVDANGDEVLNFVQSENVDLVVGEGEQLIIDSNETIEINGVQEDDPLLMRTDPISTESSMEIINAVNSIPQEIPEAPVIKNQSLNSAIQPPSDLETIDAVNSILEPEPQESAEQTFDDNTSRCYELVGEPSEGEMDGDEVIIENEMMLQPLKTPASNTVLCEQNIEPVVIQESQASTENCNVVSPVVIEEESLKPEDNDHSDLLIVHTDQSVMNVDRESHTKNDTQNRNISTQSESEEVKIRIISEICSTRHVPTPESTRDNELSCDSFASSNTDSDKHSMPSPVASSSQNSHFNISIIQSSSKPPPPPSRVKTPERKPKKRSRSGSGDSRSSSTTTVITLEYMCEWSGCKRCFENAKSVYSHVYKIHLSRNPEGYCLWDGCEKLLRKRWSLATHVQDHHCSDSALQGAAIRRFQASQTGTQAQNPRIPALVYPPDAAWQAIRRFTPKPPYPEFTEPREGPVTKHIRLTAALILRNLARYSSFGRSLIKKHESHINYTAMSTVESSTALANCLWEILHDTC